FERAAELRDEVIRLRQALGEEAVFAQGERKRPAPDPERGRRGGRRRGRR
ncbi:MAG: hypothetical protein HYU66_28965, partial [Armatimonadetes bacterium]|nr:hypothetical protein [Armatimonadota bacterium]